MSIYGEYRTRTFGQIFPTFDAFETFFNNCPIPDRLLTGDEEDPDKYQKYGLDAIYALLVSEYFGAHIAHSSEDWFKLRVMQIIYEYAPAWQREMYLQDRIMSLSDDEIRKGSYAIHNHAMHPSTTPSDQTLEELPYIDDQNVNKWRKDKVKSYVEASAGLDDSITRRFLNLFKKLFVKFIVPTGHIYYEEDEE